MSEENKIYIGGLSHDTTSDGLRAHFNKFGTILDSIVMVDKPSGRSRGFGFVIFEDAGAMNSALGTSNTVEGREVSCKKAVRENLAAIVQGNDGIYNTVKLFVGGLPASCDYDKFSKYFERYGSIEDAVVMMDSQTGRHRGFGYVTFSDPAAVEGALQNYSGHQIDGKWIEVKRCVPQDRMAIGSGTSKGGGKGKVSSSKGGGGGGCGGYGANNSGYYGAFSYPVAAMHQYNAYNAMAYGSHPYMAAYGPAYGGAYGAAYNAYATAYNASSASQAAAMAAFSGCSGMSGSSAASIADGHSSRSAHRSAPY